MHRRKIAHDLISWKMAVKGARGSRHSMTVRPAMETGIVDGRTLLTCLDAGLSMQRHDDCQDEDRGLLSRHSRWENPSNGQWDEESLGIGAHVLRLLCIRARSGLGKGLEPVGRGSEEGGQGRSPRSA